MSDQPTRAGLPADIVKQNDAISVTVNPIETIRRKYFEGGTAAGVKTIMFEITDVACRINFPQAYITIDTGLPTNSIRNLIRNISDVKCTFGPGFSKILAGENIALLRLNSDSYNMLNVDDGGEDAPSDGRMTLPLSVFIPEICEKPLLNNNNFTFGFNYYLDTAITTAGRKFEVLFKYPVQNLSYTEFLEQSAMEDGQDLKVLAAESFSLGTHITSAIDTDHPMAPWYVPVRVQFPCTSITYFAVKVINKTPADETSKGPDVTFQPTIMLGSTSLGDPCETSQECSEQTAATLGILNNTSMICDQVTITRNFDGYCGWCLGYSGIRDNSVDTGVNTLRNNLAFTGTIKCADDEAPATTFYQYATILYEPHLVYRDATKKYTLNI